MGIQSRRRCGRGEPSPGADGSLSVALFIPRPPIALCEYPEYPMCEYSAYPAQIERLITLAHARGTSVPQALVLVCASERHVRTH